MTFCSKYSLATLEVSGGLLPTSREAEAQGIDLMLCMLYMSGFALNVYCFSYILEVCIHRFTRFQFHILLTWLELWVKPLKI